MCVFMYVDYTTHYTNAHGAFLQAASEQQVCLS